MKQWRINHLRSEVSIEAFQEIKENGNEATADIEIECRDSFTVFIWVKHMYVAEETVFEITLLFFISKL